MKVEIPAQVKEVCDICGRDCVLTTCIVCGKRYCLICHCYLAGCMVRPDVCRKCDDREDVKRIATAYGKEIFGVCKRRDAELKALSANTELSGGGPLSVDETPAATRRPLK